jgi:hypothetical protein
LYADSVLIGEGSLKSEQMVDDFTEFVVNFEYTSSDIPDIAIIEFTIESSLGGNQLHQGSKWYLDSLTFGPLSDIGDENEKFPLTFSLYQNYPNPFNPATTIRYNISEPSFVSLKVYDVLGNEIATLINEAKSAGNYEVEFDGTELSSGIYLYQLSAGNPEPSSGQGFVETKKMILLK